MRILVLLALAAGCFFGSAPAMALEQPGTQLSVPASRPVLRQGDERWRQLLLGGSLRAGAYGCAVFAFRDALEELGYRYEPAEFIELLRSRGMLPGGRLRLGDASWLHTELVSERRAAPTGQAALEEALRLTDEGALVLLMFDRGERNHWVLLSPRRASDGSPVVRDPARGMEIVLDALYDPRQIAGMTVLRRTTPVRMAAS